ncbi:YheC/YheD family protein [Exiguobacterium sp. JMULE1]|uniref:YheC/YheD family protein n=1 Tax=Exiguobacterium sp. JMULE1 TaxID=2518339 RepID=UPI00157775F2|nr:YheC/YheD family protein [Exiguobacterium sp. JMULE1]
MIVLYNNMKSPRTILPKERVHHYIEQAHHLGRQLASCMIEDVDFEAEVIHAEVYDGEWRRQTIPFPSLLLNENCVVPSKSMHPEEDLRLQQVIPHFFHLIDDKYLLQQRLEKSGSWDTLFIPTKRLTGFDQFLKQLKQHSVIVLKPSNASKGTGIYKIMKAAGLGYSVTIQDERHTYTYQQLHTWIHSLVEQGNYIMQPFVISRTASGETFHLRTHLIRNAFGQWTVLTSIADIAKKGRFITNWSGYKTERADVFLQSLYPEGAFMHRALLEQSLLLAKAIDALYPFTLPELALDFALDETCTLRFFEANTGPEIIAYKEEREQRRAEALIPFADAVSQAIKGIPIEQRFGRYFKVGQ